MGRVCRLRHACWVLLLWVGQVQAAVVAGFNGGTLAPNDDGSTAQVPLGFEVSLFGTRYSNVYVNNNGNITFDGPLSTFTPFNLLSTNRLIVAPFFADVDTRSAGQPVTFGTGTFENRPAFGVNWVDVDYYSSSTSHTRRNSFQLLIVRRADRGNGDFDIVFNYDRIQWEAGQASGSSPDGLGGSSARAGYAIGSGAPGSAFELAGSAVNGAFLDGSNGGLVSGSRNSGVPGRYIFEIRTGASTQVSTLTPFGNAPSTRARSDATGRFVVFQSQASNLIAGDTNAHSDVFVIDTRTGVTRRVSVDNAGAAINADSIEATISRDGNLVAFVAPDTGVGAVLGETPAAKRARQKQAQAGVFLRNLLTGTTQRVGSGTMSGSGTLPALAPGASATAIVYTATNTNSAVGAVGQDNVYLVPLTRMGNAVVAGAARCVSCKSVGSNGVDTGTNADGASRNASVSSDGRRVVWETAAKNTIAGTPPVCTGANAYVMLRDMLSGATQRVSNPASSAQCGAAGTGSGAPQTDANGTTIVFESTQPLKPGDANNASDVYRVDVGTGTLARASETSTGADGNGGSSQAAISGDGRMIAFISAATNLDAASSDSNGQPDLHVRATTGAAMVRLASNDLGQQADGASSRPGLSHDGALIVFDANAGNLAPGAIAGMSNVFQRANPLVSPALKSATWWVDTEAGWGLVVFDQGNVLAPAWFTYDTDGEPIWLLSAAVPASDGSYSGDLYRFGGVPLNQGTGTASESTTLVGNVKLTYAGDASLTFQYTYNSTTQTKRLTRFPYASNTVVCRASPTASRAAATNFTDVWWGGSANPGWGLILTHIDSALYAVWYTYDSDHEPLFLIALTSRQGDGSFTGSVYRQRNGTPLLQIAGAPPSPGSDVVGSATFRFTNGETGTFAYTVGGVSQTKAISRYQFGTIAALCDSAPVTQ